MTIRLLVLAAVIGFAAPVSAQNPGDAGTTGSEPPKSTDTRNVATDALGALLTGPKLNVGLSIYGGYNQTNLSSAPGSTGALSSSLRTGTTAGVNAQFSTVANIRRVTFGFGGGSASNYFRATDRFLTSYHGQMNQAIRVGKRSSLNASQNVSVAPFYALNQFQGLQGLSGGLSGSLQPTVTAALGDARQYRYAAMLDYTLPLTSRTGISMQYAADASALAKAKPTQFFQTAAFRSSWSLTKSLGFHVGYGYSEARFQALPDQRNAFHNIDVGLDLNRGLSLTRRAKLGFSTGTTLNRSALVQAGTLPTNAPAPKAHLQFNLIGRATLSYDLGRTWGARVNYGRTWQVVDGTTVPFLGDVIDSAVSGQLSKKVSTGTSISYLLRGQQQVNSTQSLSRGQAVTANAFLNFRTSARLFGFVQYGYYRQEFDLSQLGLNLPSSFTRQNVRGGLTLTFRSR